MGFLFLSMLTGALIVELVRKYILRIKDPIIEDLWMELDEQDWYVELIKNPKIKDFIQSSKEKGLLNNTDYVRKIIDKEGHREGFIKYVYEKIMDKK
jgi:hypothetical protein